MQKQHKILSALYKNPNWGYSSNIISVLCYAKDFISFRNPKMEISPIQNSHNMIFSSVIFIIVLFFSFLLVSLLKKLKAVAELESRLKDEITVLTVVTSFTISKLNSVYTGNDFANNRVKTLADGLDTHLTDTLFEKFKSSKVPDEIYGLINDYLKNVEIK